MRRVVVTGLGIVSSIGNNADEVTGSLRDARSGKIVFGDKGYEFSATLEDIETWLDEEEAKLYGDKE